MTIHVQAAEWLGKPIRAWNAEEGNADPKEYIYRIELTYEEEEDEEGLTWLDVFSSYMASPQVEQTTALVIGSWGYDEMLESSEEVVEALVSAREKLPNLTALFLGDVTSEECEMSWINQSEVSP